MDGAPQRRPGPVQNEAARPPARPLSLSPPPPRQPALRPDARAPRRCGCASLSQCPQLPLPLLLLRRRCRRLPGQRQTPAHHADADAAIPWSRRQARERCPRRCSRPPSRSEPEEEARSGALKTAVPEDAGAEAPQAPDLEQLGARASSSYCLETSERERSGEGEAMGHAHTARRRASATSAALPREMGRLWFPRRFAREDSFSACVTDLRALPHSSISQNIKAENPHNICFELDYNSGEEAQPYGQHQETPCQGRSKKKRKILI
ncbi:uncharacterized protein LOC134297134 [Anolis carolinensis]|uniref:uncharacterized protein LOC134297134 n=1 Tax=Anolis carolinensis TaxID=28377 RepID=UPI002F2B5492